MYTNMDRTPSRDPLMPPESLGRLGVRRSFTRRNPQERAVYSVSFLLITGGMSINWSLGFSAPGDLRPTTYMRTCWFLAAIIGAFFGAVLTSQIPKRSILLVSSLLIALGGILFLAFPTHLAALMIARHLNGFAVGVAFVPALVVGGELAAPHRRGNITSSIESKAVALGAYLQIEIVSRWHITVVSANQVHGLLCILFGLLLPLAIFALTSFESPVYLLLHDRRQDALVYLRRLQQPLTLSTETHELLQEHELYIAENKERTLRESFIESLPALAKLSLLRAIVGLNFSLIVNIAYIDVALVVASHPFYLNGLFRLIGSLLGGYLMDTMGRKYPLISFTLLGGATAIGIGREYPWPFRMTDATLVVSTTILLSLHHFFAGLAATSSSVYLSEAFPLTAKPYCIAATFAVEMIVHVIIACIQLGPFSVAEYFYVLGSLSFLFAGFVAICFPETKNTTLRQAQKKFQAFLSRECTQYSDTDV